MESFVFNSFKKRLLEGKVKLQDKWKHFPVTKKFAENYGDDARSMETSASFIMYDMANNPEYAEYNKNDSVNSQFYNWYVKYKPLLHAYQYCYKPMGEQDIASKPEFVTLDGWSEFINKHPDEAHLYALFFNPDGGFYKPSGFYDKNTGDVIPRGFYYVKIKEELVWCANKVNASMSFDNEINIVLGDNIGVEQEPSVLNFCIGSNPAQPFNGIFFGNGYGFINCELHCKGDVGGIIGYLGNNALSRDKTNDRQRLPGTITYVWVRNCSIVNDKDISLTHLIGGGFDVAAGFLCGKNDGHIDHIYVFDHFGISGFIPKMYSCSSKADRPLETANGDPETNIFYPDYLCYNSLGNIVPYIGYFNEGVFATYSGYSKYDNKMHTYWNTEDTQNGYSIKTSLTRQTLTSPMSWGYTYGPYYIDSENSNYAGRLFHYTAPANRKNILWYDTYILAATMETHNGSNTIGIGSGGCAKMHGALLVRDDDFMQNFKALEYAKYFDTSIKMNQQNRAAYYVSPIAGINAGGVMEKVYVDTGIDFSGTFVGFAGGLAGKMTRGIINNCYVNISAADLLSTEGIPVREKQNTYDAEDPLKNYSFTKKSIKNIGGLFGSIVVGNYIGIQLNSVHSYFENQMGVFTKDLDYPDYYFDNRYGGIAAIIEYNSCNISDIWYFNSEIAKKFNDITDYAPSYDISISRQTFNDADVNKKDGGHRSISIIGCNFNYAETNINETGNSILLSYLIDNDISEVFNYGVSSPLFAEIKPTYLSVPSVITTPFYNTSYTIPEGGIISGEHVGLFTMDQQLAVPQSDPNYWSINLEVDLPGVANGGYLFDYDAKKGWKYSGYAGGVIDALNASSGENFSLDIRDIPSKLIAWQNSTVKSTVLNKYGSYFTTVTLPEAAKIPESYYETILETPTKQGTIKEESDPNSNRNYHDAGNGINLLTKITKENKWESYRAIMNDSAAYKRHAVGDWNANKKLLTYPYFGSDIKILPNYIKDDDNNGNGTRDCIDLTKNYYDFLELIFDNLPYHGENGGTGSSPARFMASKLRIRIKREAFEYVPFGTKQFSNVHEIDNLYRVHVQVDVATEGMEEAETWYPSRNWRWYDEDMSDKPLIPEGMDEEGGGDETGGISFLPDFWDADEGDAQPARDWFDNNANGARWGWYFFIDDDSGDKEEYYNLFLAFDIQPYKRETEKGCFPPNWPFIVGYVGGQKTNDHHYRDTNDWYPNYNKPMKPLWNNTSIKFYRGGLDDETDLKEIHLSEDDEMGDINYFDIAKPDFTSLGKVGHFRNNLVRSKSTKPEGYTEEVGIPEQMRQVFNKDDWYHEYGFHDWLDERIKKAQYDTKTEENRTYFKYTYTRKKITSLSDTDLWPWTVSGYWDVKYDYYNNHAGFWFKNKNVPYSAEYKNDKFTYSENYLTFGMTLNEDCILKKLEDPNIRKDGQLTSAFDADDFEGIYVTDSDYNPVMYIDVGLGECSIGTTWSYKCLSNYADDNFPPPSACPDIKGLLLEVNSDVETESTSTEEDE